MILFNCSQSFAEFIEPKHAGPAPLVGEAPSPYPSEDGPHLIDVDGQPPRHVQQWLVHFVRIQRKACAVAMDIDTRYAMVFSHLKKGDPEVFLNAFATRLVNEMVLAATEIGMLADFEAMLSRFLEQHQRFQFVRRMERSTQAHLKEAVWDFDNHCYEARRVPETHEECAMIDGRINRMIRNKKGRKDYFVPSTEMLCRWLADTGGLTAAGEAAVREKIEASYLKRRHPQGVPSW